MLARDTDAFYDAVSDLVRLYQFRERDRVGACGVTPTECYTLDALARLGPLSVSAIAAELSLHKSTASRIVARLDAAGLLLRQDEPGNHRAWRVTLTEAGEALHARTVAVVKDEHRDLLRALSAEERRLVTRTIENVTDAARARIQGTVDRCASPSCTPDLDRKDSDE